MNSQPQQFTQSLIVLEGLTCASEAASLEHHLGHVPGIVEVTVNPLTEIAYITFDPSLANTPMILRHIEEAGFRGAERQPW